MATTSRATGRIAGLLDSVPGYRGYRNKEDRRDADRRVRERVAAAFAAQADRVERVGRDLANQRRLATSDRSTSSPVPFVTSSIASPPPAMATAGFSAIATSTKRRSINSASSTKR